jgi:hypothetical protein
MSFEQTLKQHFPGSVTEDEFVRRTYEELQKKGFDGPNGFACVAVCRDELTRPLVDLIQKVWGEAFTFSSLGGLLFLGRTGFLAAQHHAPRVGGKERYVFFALAHIALDAQGQVGVCVRPGRDEISSACGALVAFRKELESGRLSLALDPDDMEQSLLKQRLIPLIRYGEVPDLVTLTRAAEAAIREDLERMLDQTVDRAHADYAVLTGIQVHGPDRNYVWPGALYAVVDRGRAELRL